MRQKINLLIIGSSAVLVGLIVMQYFLVKTAYEYKVEQFRLEVKEKIAKITNDYSDIDSTLFVKKDLYYKQVAEDYLLNPDRKERIKQSILQNSFKRELTAKLQRQFEQEIPDLQMDFAIVLDKFVLYNNTESDTVFAEKPLIANKLYGDLISLDNAFLVRNYVGTTSGILHPNADNSTYQLLTEDTLYVSIKNWELIVLKRMAGIFLLAVCSILVLITLFVIALKSLIQQKKISDIKTDFINNITHELKTPLATLSVSTKLLSRPQIAENPKHFNGLLDTINRQNNRLQHLIDQVMTNALGHNEIDLHKEKTAMPDFLHLIISDFQIAFPNVAISTNFSSTKTNLNLDRFHLTTAITNVLENAVKYGCQNIVVSSTVKNNEFCLAIQDDGIGISKKNQALLFDKFYRVEQGNIHTTKGLGLGLYYVEQIVKAHKGTIQIVSDLGKGATFNLNIPSV
ncbi:sensor histidine kinase [Flavobacterium tegetincola]|uniref:sensor histidine kinase n=1 Tax=Flavobacterium tegetincola TaxID=150172 RepID=UPI0003F662D8|nr:HAMP domain-containing sensor histidine kinase [Flavobacterium tegetincola]